MRWNLSPLRSFTRVRDDSVVGIKVLPTTESNVSVQLVATSTKICTAGCFTQCYHQRFQATGTLFLLLQASNQNSIVVMILCYARPELDIGDSSTVGLAAKAQNYTRYIEPISRAIRCQGCVIRQVSYYTFLTRIPTSMATVLLSTSHRTALTRISAICIGKLWPRSLTSG